MKHRTKVMNGHPLYTIYRKVRTRCYEKNNPKYHLYGGRGIKMCDEWKNDFWQFVEDMGERPSKAHSIDRIDTNGDYEPSNCRWATYKQQARNRRNNRLFTLNGKTMCEAAWAEELGISRATLHSRLKGGWPLEIALTTRTTRVVATMHDDQIANLYKQRLQRKDIALCLNLNNTFVASRLSILRKKGIIQ